LQADGDDVSAMSAEWERQAEWPFRLTP
jgi:hypothetical protein